MLRLSHSFRLEPTPSFQQAETLYRAGRKSEALNVCAAVLVRTPNHFDALHLSGVISLDHEENERALAWLQKAAEINETNARLQYHLGTAETALDRNEAATVRFRRALALDPELVVALNNMGTCLRRLGCYEEALACFEQAVTQCPNFLPARYNVGTELARVGRAEEAVAQFIRVIGAPPEMVAQERALEVRDALANALVTLGKIDEALAVARARIALDPDDPRGPWHESLILLTAGRLWEAWPLYERRWELPGFRTGADAEAPPPRVPDAAEFAGKRVHLTAEQGFGDTLQFVRYAALVQRTAQWVSVSVRDGLVSLLRTATGVDQVVADTEPAPEHDVSVSLASLPFVFSTELGTIPAEVPYLAAPADRRSAWRDRLGAFAGPRIGLCWWGSQHIPERSMPLRKLGPLLDVDGIQFHALQTDVPNDERAFITGCGRIVYHSAALTDFADTAALISCLDLVITIDTSVAHLAGALGRPVWIMLQRNADWRWLIERSDSPWYPTARLLRQKRQSDWDGVVDQVVSSLRKA
jgi:tetratricopeptide (TPR) repeat protein